MTPIQIAAAISRRIGRVSPIDGQGERSTTMTGFKTRLAILAATFVTFASAAWAQEQVASGDFLIRLDGGIKAETVSLSLQESCFGTQFRFAIVNRPNGSFLVEARRGGRPPRRSEGVTAVRRFLAGVRNVRFRGTQCVSADQIQIGLVGLLRSPPPGRDDQVSQLFTIRF